VPVVAGAGQQRHARVALQPGQRRIDADHRQVARRIGDQRQHERLVVEQQRIRPHVVGPQRLAVEVGRVQLGHGEGTAVEHDVAADLAHAELLHPPQHQPDAFEHELRVAAALDDELAVEHAVGRDRALQPDRRRPGPGRAEQVERGVGRQQLRQRGRIDGLVGPPGEPGPRAAGILHQHRHRVGRHVRARQRGQHGGGQPRLGRDHRREPDGERENDGADERRGHAGMIAWQVENEPWPTLVRMARLLVFDTSTEAMSIALCTPDAEFVFEGEGGAQASARLIPEILTLLGRAGCTLAQLDAIGFGRGPGAFTGLRTACSVAQGLALGADKPVLPIDSLMLVAEDAAHDLPAEAALDVWVAMDARMDEIYAGRYERQGGRWQTRVAPVLLNADALNARWRAAAPAVVAGSALDVFAGRLQCVPARCHPKPHARARALARLTRQQWDAGGAVDAALALPVYVRDKVAQTTAEREAARSAKAAA
jgi:tRNA threonylcarbamoyladenosine biosynthesis protein TsaB